MIDPDQDQTQRRTVGTLMVTQAMSGVALGAGATVATILAEDVSGRTELAGLGGTFQALGAALLAIPLAQVANRSGRRPSLTMGYLVGFAGAILLVISGSIRSFPLLLVASVLFGSAGAANIAARYAATDLARPDRRGRDLSLVVWVTTVGSVLGPNLAGPAEPLARALGVPVLTGPFVVSGAVLGVGALVMWVRLRPDPLVLSRRLAGGAEVIRRGSIGRGVRAINAHPRARVGVLTTSLGHVVMVSVMVMTPLHMIHGDAELEVIGLVISAHILGMYAFAPLLGMAVDRVGAPLVAVGGGLTLVTATVLAGLAPPGHSATLTLGLFLLGIGWSATFVSGSTMLVEAVPISQGAGSQGAADLVMGLSAAGGSGAAGVLVETLGYEWLAYLAALLALVIVAAAARLRRRPRTPAVRPAPDDEPTPIVG